MPTFLHPNIRNVTTPNLIRCGWLKLPVGPVELEIAAQAAIMSGDMVLAAAAMSVIDRRPRTVQAFAERVIGEVWKRLNAKLQDIELA